MESALLQDHSLMLETIKGHDTATLGPSDSSDTGSDIQGGPGLDHEDGMMSRTGSTSDPGVDDIPTAGPDLGDADLDSDSDRFGTGERGSVGRDSSEATDQVLRDDRGRIIEGESIGADEDVEQIQE